jgi:hypothetical protein
MLSRKKFQLCVTRSSLHMSQNYSREGERLCKKEKKTPKPSPGTGGG